MTTQNIFSELNSFAESGEHTKFRLLQNWQEYSFYCKVRQSTITLIDFLEKSADTQLKNYCKDIILGSTDVYKLLAYKHIIKIRNCYLIELETITDMIREYEAYLMEGNLLFAYLGDTRPADKQWDHRGL